MGIREEFRHFQNVLRSNITENLDERALEVYVEVPPIPFRDFTPLLSLLGYEAGYVDKETRLAYARTNVRPDYRIRVNGRGTTEFQWILDLKRPTEFLDKPEYVRQLFDYMQHNEVAALYGVLFNGRHAHLYVNEQIARSNRPLGQLPVVRARLDVDDDLFRLFEHLSTIAFTANPLRRARELVKKENARIEVTGQNQRRQTLIKEKVQAIRETPPENILLAIKEACSQGWSNTFEVPTIQDVQKHWNPKEVSAVRPTNATGSLPFQDLIIAGLLVEGQLLMKEYKPKGGKKHSFTGIVHKDGIEVEGRVYAPSNAALYCLHKINTSLKSSNGWQTWKTADGTVLSVLRDKLLLLAVDTQPNAEATA